MAGINYNPYIQNYACIQQSGTSATPVGETQSVSAGGTSAQSVSASKTSTLTTTASTSTSVTTTSTTVTTTSTSSITTKGTSELNSWLNSQNDYGLDNTAKIANIIKGKYKFTDDYSKMLAKFVMEKLEINKTDRLTAGKYREIYSIVDELRDDVKLNSWFETAHSNMLISEKLFDGKNENVQEEFLAYMLNNCCKFNTDEERDNFLLKVLVEAAEKAGIDYNYNYNHQMDNNERFYFIMVNLSELSKLNQNDKSWLDDIYEIINQYAEKINSSNYESESKIDIDALFKGKDSIDAVDLASQYNDMMFSDSPSIIKLRTYFAKAMTNSNVISYYDQEYMFKFIIQYLNDAAGVENTIPPTLTKETLEILNKSDIFGKLDEIVSGEKLKNAYENEVDGVIDNVGQAPYTGECWLLAGLITMSNSELGRKLISEAITQDENGDFDVYFKGYKSHIKVTKEELQSARKENKGYYSYGDSTVKVIELAMEKYRRVHGTTHNDSGNPGQGIHLGNATELFGAFSNLLSNYKITTEDEYYSKALTTLPLDKRVLFAQLKQMGKKFDIKDYVQPSYEEYVNCINYQLSNKECDSFYNVIIQNATLDDKNISLKTVTGEDYSIFVPSRNGHEFGVIEYTEDTITIADPQFPDTHYTFYTEELIKAGFYVRCYNILEQRVVINEPEISVDTSFLEGGGERDKTFTKDILIGDDTVSVEDILNADSEYKLIPENMIYMIFTNVRTLTIDYSKFYESLICNIVDSLCSSMENYTDYTSLISARKRTINNFIERFYFIKLELKQRGMSPLECAVYAESNMPELFDVKSIIQEFLSYLPD